MTATPFVRLRLPGFLRVEDVVLFLWLVLRPLVVPDRPGSGTIPGYDPLGGLFDLVALCGAAACIAARRGDATHTGLVREQDIAYAAGPLFGAVAFALDDCVARLGLSGGLESIPLVAPVLTGVVARQRLRPTTSVQRRALVTPFVLATSGYFGDVVSGLTGVFDLRYLAEAFGSQAAVIPPVLVFGLGLLGTLVFYVMLVFAPRQIAEREGTATGWTLRFLVFVLGLSIGTTLAGFVHDA